MTMESAFHFGDADFEKMRLRSLMECRLLDTPEAQEFNEIVELGAFVADTPICLVSLVDDARQWFKARVGLDVRETPRKVAFCDYAIRSSATLVVPDALLDGRFKDNPLVLEGPKIRFYAGVPLEVVPGYPIGTLCVIDTRPREIEPARLARLTMLARQACDQIRLRRSLYDLENAAGERAAVAEGSRLAGLREMAGGLAHEVNNPLALILAKNSLISQHTKLEKMSATFILEQSKSIGEIVARIAGLVRNLRAFAGIEPIQKPERVCLQECIQDALAFCGQKITDAGIYLDLAPRLKEVFVLGNRLLLSQVFLNLLNNAHDSIRELPTRRILITAEDAPAGWIRCAVEDSGPPIPVETRKRLFEPFFTTKPTGVGTGLGLSISAGVLASHGGRLAYDESHEYCRFTLDFPHDR